MSDGTGSNQRIKVAFLDIGSTEWYGGLYYYRNLLYALSTLEKKEIEPIVFVGRRVDQNLIKPLEKFAPVVRSSLFDKNSYARNIARLSLLLTGSNVLRNIYLKKQGIQVVSHSNIRDRATPFKVINWIPDLQHNFLPELFSQKEIVSRNKLFREIIEKSDMLLLSSNAAFADLKDKYTVRNEHIKVLNFVASLHGQAVPGQDEMQKISNKFGIEHKFFYLPNQFWKHKNHLVVFEAVRKLKNKGIEVLILCSGHMNDYRNREHVNYLHDYIRRNNLEANVKLLGLIEREEVLALMRFSIAVINPSYFEGWSSTVEEAKSLGKTVILSDINVHKEQNPPGGRYFSPGDQTELSEIIEEMWISRKGGPDEELEENARRKLPGRVQNFALAYQDMVVNMVGNFL